MTPEELALEWWPHYAPAVRLVHAILATVGLLVIAGFVVASLADAWLTLMVVVGIAAAAGLVTSVVVPREEREQWLRRLGH